ncbi:hypothetical protein BKA67DRAFT_326360 [Truncatella angustata]|uniref:HVA22-like protein n=1 Tax=Truncatella angustata TaxID=152316 RepID=A0A9P8ZY25_9PEZI|nr:uncharacterized protein BKA67DRAFT_326360 [Truncatella angustata]KAH6653613.1 hypothetical protein BKA67DRAFT_326360 [Truncatella angustata]
MKSYASKSNGLSIYMMLNNILGILNSTLSLFYPLLATFKALKTSNTEELREWLMYWSILSTVTFIESLSHSVL